MKAFSSCLMGLVTLLSVPANAVTVKEARASYTYVNKALRENAPLRDIDTAVLRNHAQVLNEALDTFSIGPQGYRMLLDAHLNAEKMLIKQAQLMDLPYDVSAIQISLDRVDALIPTLEKGQGGMLYTAGHVASYILEDKELAYQYWLGCAELAHPGCMNIMATSYESGAGTMPQDETSAVYWHKEVVDTGTYARCAGGFSAASLALLQFTGVETGEPIQFWLDKADNLLQQIVDAENDPQACNLSEVDLLSWLFTQNDEALERLKAFEFDTTNDYGMSRNLVRDALLQTDDFNVFAEIMPAIVNDNYRCRAASLFALKVHEQPDQLREIQQYVRELPPFDCGRSQATVNRLLSLHI